MASGHPTRKSPRLDGFNYASSGAYFITICTDSRVSRFGQVTDGTMHLSRVGRIAEEEWLRTPSVRSGVSLDVHVVMPNHLHGILLIDDAGIDLGRLPATVGAIIRGYKGATTRRVTEALPSSTGKVWQRGYYDHIIRSESDMQRIREYIVNNPLQWSLDRYFQGE